MFTLFHHPFCPHSRFIRLAIGEHGLDLRLVEERVWERREAFLALNPAGTTPVLVTEGEPPIPGAAVIAEYLDEAHGADMEQRRLMPKTIGERVEVRRRLRLGWNVYDGWHFVGAGWLSRRRRSAEKNQAAKSRPQD